MDSVSDEIECRSAFHLDRLARMMRQYECRHMVRRLIAPPSFPFVIGPRSTDRAEHIPSEYPGAITAHTLRREVIVDARFSTLHSVLLAESLRFEKRGHQLRSVHT